MTNSTQNPTSSQNKNVYEILDDFVKFDKKTALYILWKLIYGNSAEAFSELDTIAIPKRYHSKFIADLTDTYVSHHPDFLTIEIPDDDNCEFYLNELADQTARVTTKIVSNRCYKALGFETPYEETLALLNDNNANNILQGFLNLGFNEEEAKYLLPLRQEIHNLFASFVTCLENTPVDILFVPEDLE